MPSDFDIFVSYSRQDSKLVEPLVRALERDGSKVWWDQHLEPGDPHHRRIRDRIGQAKAVLVLWSRASAESNWVIAEASAALTLGKLVPALIETCNIPLPFNSLHTISLLSRRYQADDQNWESLRKALRSRASVGPLSADRAQPGPIGRGFVTSRLHSALSWGVLFGGVGALCVLGTLTPGLGQNQHFPSPERSADQSKQPISSERSEQIDPARSRETGETPSHATKAPMEPTATLGPSPSSPRVAETTASLTVVGRNDRNIVNLHAVDLLGGKVQHGTIVRLGADNDATFGVMLQRARLEPVRGEAGTAWVLLEIAPMPSDSRVTTRIQSVEVIDILPSDELVVVEKGTTNPANRKDALNLVHKRLPR